MIPPELDLPDEAATVRLGTALAAAVRGTGGVIHLRGELGSGKTALARALLRGLGFSGAVRSPTYTLLEIYEMAGRRIFHLDLYRLRAAAEAEYLGLGEIDPATDLVLVEWPENGGDALPVADLVIRLAYEGLGRRAGFEAGSARGTTILSGLSQGYTT